jgi:hypothetical protein
MGRRVGETDEEDALAALPAAVAAGDAGAGRALPGDAEGKYMLLRGWTNLAAVVILGLVLVLPIFAQEWWFRVVYLLLFGLQVYMFGRWERSWEEWQRMRLPTVEEAEAIVDELRNRAEYHADDPFEQQITYEAAREVDMWIKGKQDDDDR